MDQMQKDNFAIIIPAFNEAGRIERTVRDIKNICGSDIIVIDDGSTDLTVVEAKSAGAEVIQHPFNLGYGAALQTGYQYALKEGYRFAVQMDADGQHDPYYIEKLLEVVRNNATDVAIGSRFLGEGAYKQTILKKIGIDFFKTIASVITKRRITDPTSGFQALNKRAMEFYASEAYPVDFPDADVLIMLHRRGLRFKEIPVKMNHNAKQKSMHSGIVPLYYVFKMILSIFITLLREKKEET